MKSTWKLALCILLIGATVFCLTACDAEHLLSTEPTETKPTINNAVQGGGGAHHPGESTTPTETTLPPHVHEYTVLVVAPTCTVDGYSEYTCACGDVYQSDVVAATGHNYTSTVTDPTCVDQGYTEHVCTVCEDTYTDSYTEPTGIHTIERRWRIWKGVPCHCCSICDYAEYYTSSDAVGLADPMRDFEKEVANAFIQYINDYRATDGTARMEYLPGMSQVAQYRSRQLVENFETDTEAIQEAHNYYEYGIFMDMTIYGQESYYTTVSSEGIGCYDMRDKEQKYTVKELAQNWVNACYDSSSHWDYVGSSRFTNVGVGVHYDMDSDLWYVCIMLSAEKYE